MGKRKKNKRQYRLIGFKAFQDIDTDIIAWWDDLEDGSRSAVIRDLIREYLGMQPRLKKRGMDLPELAEVRSDTAWIRSALTDMPVFIERIVQQMAAMQPVARSPDDVSQSALNSTEKHRRTNKLQERTW